MSELATKLKDLEGQTSGAKLSSSQQDREIHRLREANGALQARLDVESRRTETLEAEAMASRRKLAECTEELARVNANALETHGKLGGLLQSVREGFDKEQQNFLGQIDALKRERDQTRVYAADLQARVDGKDAEMLKLRADLRAAQLAGDADSRARLDLEREVATLRAQAQGSSLSSIDAEQRAARAEGALQRAEAQREAAKDELARALRDREAACADVGLSSCHLRIT